MTLRVSLLAFSGGKKSYLLVMPFMNKSRLCKLIMYV